MGRRPDEHRPGRAYRRTEAVRGHAADGKLAKYQDIIEIVSPDQRVLRSGFRYWMVAENLAATDAYIKSEIRKWARVVEAAKISAE